MFRKVISFVVLVTFAVSSVFSNAAYAQALALPAPGAMVETSAPFAPLILKGVQIQPENPMLFDFIVDTGDTGLKAGQDDAAIGEEAKKLIKYFMASLTLPEEDQWVNLSPYEQNRIMPEALGQTELGRDMLAQDYMLKQVTASLVYPEKELGKQFWARVYDQVQQKFGNNVQVPADTFNKVWVTADRAEVYVHKNTGFVAGSHLKVMLESDYLASQKAGGEPVGPEAVELAKQVVREVVIPALETEVNTGKNFANLRQIFNSMILATWYKQSLKAALLNQVYANKGKTNGVQLGQTDLDPQAIYARYVEAYKKGVFDLIKEDTTAAGESLPRRYFSGGIKKEIALNEAESSEGVDFAQAVSVRAFFDVSDGANNVTKAIQKLKDTLVIRTDQGGTWFGFNISQLEIGSKVIKEVELNNLLAELALRSRKTDDKVGAKLDNDGTFLVRTGMTLQQIQEMLDAAMTGDDRQKVKILLTMMGALISAHLFADYSGNIYSIVGTSIAMYMVTGTVFYNGLMGIGQQRGIRRILNLYIKKNLEKKPGIDGMYELTLPIPTEIPLGPEDWEKTKDWVLDGLGQLDRGKVSIESTPDLLSISQVPAANLNRLLNTLDNSMAGPAESLPTISRKGESVVVDFSSTSVHEAEALSDIADSLQEALNMSGQSVIVGVQGRTLQIQAPSEAAAQTIVDAAQQQTGLLEKLLTVLSDPQAPVESLAAMFKSHPNEVGFGIVLVVLLGAFSWIGSSMKNEERLYRQNVLDLINASPDAATVEFSRDLQMMTTERWRAIKYTAKEMLGGKGFDFDESKSDVFVIKASKRKVLDALRVDNAMAPGGIDMNARNMTLNARGDSIDLKADPAMIAQFSRGDFTGLTPVIYGIQVIANPRALLGAQ